MIIKMIVGALFFLMTLLLGYLLGKEAERKEVDKREKNRQ